MGLVVGIYSVIGGLVLGLLIAAVFARRSEGVKGRLVNFLGVAYFAVPASVVVIFHLAFWVITGNPPIKLFDSRPDVDIPPASSAQDYIEYYMDGQIKIKGTRTEGEFGSFFGPLNAWYFNGQKAFERSYDEQVPFSRYKNRQWTEWHENGLKKAQRVTLPNKYEEVQGPYHDRVTQWYDNGQKYTEGDVEHGKNLSKKSIHNWLGVHREWYPSGQLKCEWLKTNRGIRAWYENGKPLYENLDPRYGDKGKFWDEQGNLSERHKPKDVCVRYEIDYLTAAHLVEDHPFDGTWRSDTELTLDYARANRDLSEDDIRTIRRVTGKDVLEINRHKVMVNYQFHSMPAILSVVSKEDGVFKLKYGYEILSTDGVHEHVVVSEDEFYIQLPDKVWVDYSFFSEVIPLERLYFLRVKKP